MSIRIRIDDVNDRYRRARTGKALAVVALVIVILGATGWIVAGWLAGASSAPDGGREIATTFLQQIREGKANAAWEATTAEFKSDQGRESFLLYVRQNRSLAQAAEFISTQEVSANNLPRTECVFRVASPARGKGTLRVLLANERGTWKVERLTVE